MWGRFSHTFYCSATECAILSDSTLHSIVYINIFSFSSHDNIIDLNKRVYVISLHEADFPEIEKLVTFLQRVTLFP